MSKGTILFRDGAELVGRVLLAGLFLIEGTAKLRGYGDAAAYMALHHLLPTLLPFGIAIELAAGASLALGWRMRPAALVLAIFCVITALIFHLKLGDRNQVLHLEKDLALAGALLMVWARDAGRFSLDARSRSLRSVSKTAAEAIK